MTIDISDILLAEEGAQREFIGEVFYKDTVYQGDKLHFISPLKVECTVSNGRDCLYLTANVHGEMTIPCSRCVKPFTHNIDLSFTEKLNNANDVLDEDDLDIYTYQGNEFKVDRMVFEHIILDLPIKRVCSTNCKGLCPKCGIDLNEKQCNCDRDDDIDIRLLELKKLLPSNDEEV